MVPSFVREEIDMEFNNAFYDIKGFRKSFSMDFTCSFMHM